MAVHFTIYLDEQAASELRRHMAEHDCTATESVERLLAHATTTPGVSAVRPLPGWESTGAVA